MRFEKILSLQEAKALRDSGKVFAIQNVDAVGFIDCKTMNGFDWERAEKDDRWLFFQIKEEASVATR